MEVVGPVWLNTYWVHNALGLSEGIWRHAEELNTYHGHFFGLATKYAIESAVLGICKLYDGSNAQFKKDTVLNLSEHLRSHFTVTYAGRLGADLLVELGASAQTAQGIVASIRCGRDFSRAKEKICGIIDQHMPRPEKGTPLKRLLTHRNKVIAHQQQLTTLTALVREELNLLPSLNEMENLNRWAMAFCRLVVTVLSDETLLPHALSARTAALNVVAKALGKNFDHINTSAAYQEREQFYSRL